MPPKKATETPAPKAKKEKAPEVPMVTSKMLADELGTKPATLRRYLRSLPMFQDSTYTRYKWPVGDKFLTQAKEGFEKFKASEKEKNAKRLATLKEKEAGKKAAPAKAAKKAKKNDEEVIE